jgi:hypothetical protein
MQVAYVFSYGNNQRYRYEFKILDAHMISVGDGLVTISGQIMRWRPYTQMVEVPEWPQWLYKLMKWPLTHQEEETGEKWVPDPNLNTITVQSSRVEIFDTAIP